MFSKKQTNQQKQKCPISKFKNFKNWLIIIVQFIKNVNIDLFVVFRRGYSAWFAKP